MRKVVLYTGVSRDGYIATLDDGLGWMTSGAGGEDYGYAEFYREVETVVMGRRTWDIVRALAPNAHSDRELIVLSRQKNDGVALMRELRNGEGGIIWLVGGGIVNGDMLKADLIDELILSEIPCDLGLGIPIFGPSGTTVPDTFTCVREKLYDDGVKQTIWHRR